MTDTRAPRLARRPMRRWPLVGLLLVGTALALLPGCCSQPPLPTVAYVDLERFQGDWFVVAHIPASSEANAHNAVESYQLLADGTIATTYVFRDGAFDGPFEVMQPSAIVRDENTNATWGMRFFWPFRFEYLITHLDPEYRTVIVARTARDYAWIMARTPQLAAADYDRLVGELQRQGYDVQRLRRVPQRWPDPGHPTFAARPAAAPR